MLEKEKFAQRLNLLLQQHNKTKQALSDAIGVSRPAISQFANGANLPSVETLVAIAEYFNVSVDYLVGLSDIPDQR